MLLSYLEIAQEKSQFYHSVVSLDYINKNSKSKLKESNISFFEEMSKNYEELIKIISDVDIILIHWWNHPLMYEFLVKYTLPKCRVIIWSHISGLHSPSNFTKPLFRYADKFIFTTPISYEADIIKNLSFKQKQKISVIWSTAGLKHIKDVSFKKHKGFNVGYLGTVDYSKLHKDFLNISAKIDIDDIHFIVCGGDDEKNIRTEAISKGIDNKFEFVGKVDNIKPYLEKFDIFGYPLSLYHFGTCDQVLAEAMGCGIVPVVFDNAMEEYMVQDGKTGIVVKNQLEYKEAIKKLYKNKKFKSKLSKNAKEYAFKTFSLEKMIVEWENTFNDCLTITKTIKKWDGVNKGLNTTPLQIFIESINNFNKLIEYKFTSNLLNSKTKGSLNHYISFFDDEELKKLKIKLNKNKD